METQTKPESKAPVQIRPKFSANPLINYCISSILRLPDVNKRLRKHYAVLQEKKVLLEGVQSDVQARQRELDIFLDLVLEDLDIQWQLIDPNQQLKALQDSSSTAKTRPVLLVSNHPLGGRDGVALLACFNQLFGSKHFKALVNEFLLQLPYVQDLFLPINPLKTAHGMQKGMQQLRNLDQALAEGGCKALLLFSAGLCSRRHAQKLSLGDELAQYAKSATVGPIAAQLDWSALESLRDLPWRHSFLRLARKHQFDILPLHISGHNSARFYRLARLREKLGLRFNWEMLLLPREFLSTRNFWGRRESGKSHLSITVGALLRSEQIALWPRQHDDLWAQCCKHYVYQLPQWQDEPERAGREIEKLHQAILQTSLQSTGHSDIG